jgi:hypothetical protein
MRRHLRPEIVWLFFLAAPALLLLLLFLVNRFR